LPTVGSKFAIGASLRGKLAIRAAFFQIAQLTGLLALQRSGGHRALAHEFRQAALLLASRME
jgi:hypothetical protein